MRARFAAIGLVGCLVILVPALRGTASAHAEWYDLVPGSRIVVLGEHCVSGDVTFDDIAMGVFDAVTLPFFVGPSVRLVKTLIWIKGLDEIWLVGPAVRSAVVGFLRSDIGMTYVVKPYARTAIYASIARHYMLVSGRWVAAHIDDAANWTGDRLSAGVEIASDAGRFVWAKAGRAYDGASDGIHSAWEWVVD